MNTFKRFLQVILHPINAIRVAQGYYVFCDTCDHISTGGVGYVDSTTDKSVMTCSKCCAEENKNIIHKFENDNKIDQIIEYNSYDMNENKIGGIRIGYFTEEQVKKTQEILKSLH